MRLSCCKSDTGDQKCEKELMSIKELLDREKLLITPTESEIPSLQRSDPAATSEQLDPIVLNLA